MTEFEYKRLDYLIKQAEQGTYVALNKGDAVILQELIKKHKDEFEWSKTLTLVREQLKDG